MRTRTTFALLTGLLVAAVGLVACGTAVGSPEAAPTGSSTNPAGSSDAPSSSAAPKAPSVTHPLDASKLLSSPCSALTSADVSGLGVQAPLVNPRIDQTGAYCVWTGQAGGSVSLGWPVLNTHGLSDLYAISSHVAYFQPTTVLDYPAVLGDTTGDGRAQGECAISVGVNDHLYYAIIFSNALNPTQSCPLAAQAAADVIRTLGGS